MFIKVGVAKREVLMRPADRAWMTSAQIDERRSDASGSRKFSICLRETDKLWDQTRSVTPGGNHVNRGGTHLQAAK